MTAIKKQLKEARPYFAHGEIKRVAEKNNVAADRMYNIARGRISPHPAELPFAVELITLAHLRQQMLPK